VKLIEPARDDAASLSHVTRRTFCCGAAAALALPVRVQAQPRFDAVVSRSGGSHQSLAAALDDVPAGDQPFRILLAAGRWAEKLIITRPNVEIVGEDRHRSVLTSSVAAGHEKPGGGRWGTFGSATLTVEATGFTARNLTIENGFDYPANLRSHHAIANAQAVALALGFSADRALIDGVDVIGHQDSFYLRAGRALIRNSLIAGSVDFIFGGAAALFDDCEIRSRLRPGDTLQGYVSAPSTPRSQPIGLVFNDCRLTREAGVPEAGVPDGSVYLGRPWRAGGNVALLGAAAFLHSWMDGHIHRDGWTSMHYRGPGDYPMRFEAGDARLFEYRSRGPGARQSASRRQLNREQARLYGRSAVLGDWQPQ
jgi:pectinesterase